MKKLMILIIATLTTSVAEARITDADIDRINAEARANLLRTMPNALNPEVAQADIEKKWQLYNQPPREDGSMGIETIRVEGAQALGVWSKSYAQCPTNYKLTGGGYLLTTFNGGHGYNAPNGSFADTDRNRWVVERGGMPENRGFKAYAICMKK